MAGHVEPRAFEHLAHLKNQLLHLEVSAKPEDDAFNLRADDLLWVVEFVQQRIDESPHVHPLYDFLRVLRQCKEE